MNSNRRLVFIDVLRGLATVAMIEVHVVNALLAPTLREGMVFRIVDALNGLVAPTFLFCAGFGLARTLQKAWSDGSQWRPRTYQHLRRCGGLFVLGYILHATPLVGLAHGHDGESLGDARATILRAFLQADILQVIALALAVLALLAATTRSRERFIAAAAIACVGAILVTPAIRSFDVSRWPMAVQPYFSDHVESQFPLFPWLAFAVAGAGVGSLAGDKLGWARTLGWVGVGCVLLAAGAASLPADLLFPPHHAWNTGPAASFARLGAVCLLGGGLARDPPISTTSPAGRAVLLLGEHSLLIYFVHIAVVYGRNPLSLRSRIGPTMGWGASLIIWGLVTVAMLALALGKRAIATNRVRLLRGRA